MHVLLTGANGTIGRFILARLLADGCSVTVLDRRDVDGFETGFHPFDLADRDLTLPGADALVHCALLHEPGRFRGGEGNMPERFWAVNVDGTARLFAAAKQAGCRQAVFLSSRAVYGDHRTGEILRETDETVPDSLYGEVKKAAEEALAALCDETFAGTALRSTGVYGLPPGLSRHKWSDLFDRFARGEAIAPRRGTEVHGEDLAAAVALSLRLQKPEPFEIFNLSDLVLDRRALLTLLAEITGARGSLPQEAGNRPGTMATEKIRALGWHPGGEDRLRVFLRSLRDA